jgi:hypothetical protein
VSGPAGNAVAKDTAGKEMTDKTFTWASSDSNIASVDTSGKVTAKRFGKVKISASVDSKTGESAEQTTFGLEASGGVSIYKQGEAPSMALLVRFRNAQDTGVVQNTTALTIKGPTGWNNNTPAQVQYSGNGRTWVRWQAGVGSVPVLDGNYQISTSIDGSDYGTSFSVDTKNTLLAVTNFKVDSVNANSVSCSWNAVAGNVSYWFDSQNDTNRTYLTGINTTATSGTLTLPSGTVFEPLKTYRCAVHSRNFNPNTSTAFIDPFPAQFNTGYNAIQFGLPVTSGPKLILTIPRGQWTAFRDGQGPWVYQGQPDATFSKELPITDAGGRYGVAIGRGSGAFVNYFTLAEASNFDTSSGRCDDGDFTRTATVKPSFTFSNTTDRGGFALLRPESSDRVFNYGRSNQAAGVGSDLGVVAGSYTLIAVQRTLNSQGFLINRSPGIFLQRTVQIAAGNNPVVMDFTSGASTATINGTATIGGVPSGYTPFLATRFVPATSKYRCNSTFTLAFDESDNAISSGSYSANRYMLPASFFVSGDRLRYDASASLTTGNLTEYVSHYRFIDPGAAQPTDFSLGTPLASGEGTAVNNLPEVRNLPTAFPSPFGFYNIPFSQTINNVANSVEINVSRGWLAGAGATATVGFPDLSGLPNARSNWKLTSGEVNYTIRRLETDTAADALIFYGNRLPSTWGETGRINKFGNP